MSLPHGLYLKGIIDFWNRVNFTNKLLNSALISLSVAVFGVILSLLNAFALGIGKVRGRILLPSPAARIIDCIIDTTPCEEAKP